MVARYKSLDPGMKTHLALDQFWGEKDWYKWPFRFGDLSDEELLVKAVVRRSTIEYSS